MWQEIKGFEGLYQISDDGRVMSMQRAVKGPYGSTHILKPKELKPWEASGYLRVTFRKDGKETMPAVHRLVAEAFLPNPDNLECVNHKDGNKMNNHVSNLEWCSYSDNLKHAFKTGLNKPRAKLSEEEVTDILTKKFQGMRAGFVYEAYKHKISKPGFYSVWGGYSYKSIYNHVKEKVK